MEKINEPTTETAQDAQQGAPMEAPEETVGDIMQKASGEGIKFWVIVVSALIYLAGIVYAEVHGLTMLQNGVVPEMRIWATMGMIAAGLSAVLFPIALKVWTIEAKQRLAAYAFYALDFGFLAFNAFTDFNVNSGGQLAPWAINYTTYLLPASPVILSMMWAILWELDPNVKQKILALTLRAAMKEKMARKVADAAKGANVTATVNAAAEREVERALTELFGTPAKRASNYYVIEADQRPTVGGLARSFLDGWLRRAQSMIMSDMPTQSAPSDSNEPQP